MNDSFVTMMVGDFGPTITLIVVIALSVVAVLRFGVKFDLNKYLESRKRRHLSLARMNCPHIRLSRDEKGVCCQSLFVSPSGTLDWVCSQCGVTTHIAPDEDETEELAKYYLNHYKEYEKRTRQFENHAKKSF